MMRVRTSIMVDPDLRLAAQQYALQRNMTYSELIEVALRAYLSAHSTPHRLSFMGLGHSGEPVDLSDGKDEALLAAAAHPIYGLAHPPPGGWDDEAHNEADKADKADRADT